MKITAASVKRPTQICFLRRRQLPATSKRIAAASTEKRGNQTNSTIVYEFSMGWPEVVLFVNLCYVTKPSSGVLGAEDCNSARPVAIMIWLHPWSIKTFQVNLVKTFQTSVSLCVKYIACSMFIQSFCFDSIPQEDHHMTKKRKATTVSSSSPSMSGFSGSSI